ncbi:unnamed protein product [Musa textilis]
MGISAHDWIRPNADGSFVDRSKEGDNFNAVKGSLCNEPAANQEGLKTSQERRNHRTRDGIDC